jgi:N-acetylmuramoyl-L-alanine amidase
LPSAPSDCCQTYGFKTVLTRRDDTFVSLLDRADMANKYERSLFVSLHFNKSESSAATGIETYYASQKVLPNRSGLGRASSPSLRITRRRIPARISRDTSKPPW